MKTVYRTPYDIPEIGAASGDHIVIEPSHPDTPVRVVAGFGHHTLRRLMDSGRLEQLTRVAGDLRGPAAPSRPHLTLVGGEA